MLNEIRWRQKFGGTEDSKHVKYVVWVYGYVMLCRMVFGEVVSFVDFTTIPV